MWIKEPLQEEWLRGSGRITSQQREGGPSHYSNPTQQNKGGLHPLNSAHNRRKKVVAYRLTTQQGIGGRIK